MLDDIITGLLLVTAGLIGLYLCGLAIFAIAGWL